MKTVNLCLLTICAVLTWSCQVFAQVQGGGQVGGGNLLVPISQDDPYQVDKSFVYNFVADLYNQSFDFNGSALWIGEHVNEDSQMPRAVGLTHWVAAGQADLPADPDDVRFTEVSRHRALWLDEDTGSSWGQADSLIFWFTAHEYGDVVVGHFENQNGVSRLVVGLSFVIDLEVTSPVDQQARVLFERFVPIKRFYNDGQATNYAISIAESDLDSNILRSSAEDPFDCAGTEPLVEPFISYCACVSDINDNFDYDNGVCLSPNLGPILTGGGIGTAASVAAGPWWLKLSKRLTGLPGLAVQATGGFIVGAGAAYSIDTAACKLRAKSRRDRDMNKALTELYRVLANDQTYTCPGGVH